MPDTQKISKIFSAGLATEREYAEERRKDSDEKAQERHEKYLVEVGEIKGEIKVVQKDIEGIEKQVDQVSQTQTDHGEKLIALKKDTETATNIAVAANDKANNLIKEGAPAAAPVPVEQPPQRTEVAIAYAKKHAPGAAMGLGVFTGGGTFIYVLWLLHDMVIAYLAAH